MDSIYIFIILIAVPLLFYLIKSSINDKNNTKEMTNDFLETFQPTFDKFKLIPIYASDLPVLLRNEEYPVAVLYCDLYEERSYRNYFGGGVRINKGVSLFAGQSRSKSELQIIDNGSLIVTDERIIFVGKKRNTNIEYNKLLSLECYDNCITSHKTGKSKAEVFFTPGSNAIKYLVGLFLKYEFIMDDDNSMIIEVNQYDYGMNRLKEIKELLRNKETNKDLVFESVMKFIEDCRIGKISNFRSRDFLRELNNLFNKNNS